MLDIRKTLTPPEWSEWHWLARLSYWVVFIGIMVPIIWFAGWFGPWLVNLVWPQ